MAVKKINSSKNLVRAYKIFGFVEIQPGGIIINGTP